MFHSPRGVKTRGAIRKEQEEQALTMDKGSTTEVHTCSTKMQNRPASTAVKPEGSIRSTSSRSSIEAKKQQLIYEAAAAEAKIESDLIKKKLAADLAALEDDKSVCSRMSYKKEVENWIDVSQEQPCDMYAAASAPTAPNDISKLADALHRMVASSVANTQSQNFLRMQPSRDLPCYSGDPIEWLNFKKAYEETATHCNLSEAEKIFHLRRCLQGEAKDAVSALLMCGAHSDKIIENLELRFGRPDFIIMKIVSQLKRMSPLPPDYYKDLAVFVTKIQNFVAASHAIQETDYLRSPELLATVLSKLPNALIIRWTDFVYENQMCSKSKFKLLSDFLMSEATKIAKAGVSYLYSYGEKKIGEKKIYERRTPAHTIYAFTNSNECKFCKKGNHALPDCSQFKRAMRRDRWRFVRIHKLCYKCLLTCQDRQTCPADTCNIDGCGRNHHRLLHWRAKQSMERSNDTDNKAAGETVTTAIAPLIHSKVLLKIVPVTIHGPHKSITTYALLDDGATVSLIAADIANEVGLYGKRTTMRVRSAWESSELECQSELVNFELSNGSGDNFRINARKISDLHLPSQHVANIDFNELNQYVAAQHFCVNYNEPKLLIGQDNYHLLVPLECLPLRKNGPYATRTPLGWSLHGSLRTAPPPERPLGGARDPRLPYPAPTSDSLLHITNLLPYTSSTRDTDQSLRELNELVRNSFALEALGVSNNPRPHKDEQRAITILTDTARLVNGQWEVGLPWRSDVALPDSYPNAYRRLLFVEKKITSSQEYASRYKERITHLFENGYAREIQGSKSATRTWYLPHFAVDNPNKKKLRVVFDAAATSGGYSLNDYLLQGPDLLESLFSIMLRFREGKVAVTGDIKDMFLRIKIRQEDQDALRFLWRDNHTEPIRKYAMTSLIFGANCSPFIAQYVKNINAQRFDIEMPKAVNAIVKSHYMDDYIDSLDDTQMARKLIKQITYIHRSGGFEIRNWSSNVPEVIDDMPKGTLSNGAIEFKINDQERTLGLLWFLASDVLCVDLTFKKIPADITNLKQRPTKREVLRLMMSIYDVYGFLAPFTIKAKILLQMIWKNGLKWDEKLPDDLLKYFNEWMSQLHTVKELRIPRWYFHGYEPSCGNELDTQLHVFCDASPSAYAAVAYWRRQYSEGSVCVSLIACKTRVAPLKNVTIPRLELQAAVLACRLASVIEKEHRITASKKYYWSDSTIVLHWIKNENRNYNVFIANRLGEIDTHSKISEWHYIPTNINIADVATKLNKYKLTADSDWFKGPSFLYMKPDDWPQQPVTEKQSSIHEELLHTIDVVYNLPVNTPTVPDSNRFSSWNRLRRSTATMLLFIEKCKKTGLKQINCDLLRKAETLILLNAQAHSFSKEIDAIKIKKNLPADSRLRTLTPYLDDEGLLRVGGRIDAVLNVIQETKQPVILDGRHRVSRLIVAHYHEAAAHGCNELVVNELRQRYWIINLRPTVRTVASQCLQCRMRKIVPKPPRMGDLPEARLLHHHRPFTNCGVDLFGPMDIAVGRRREKRYGVLFTCLTIRAVHIEVVSDLSTDTLIMALRRMAARRGWPAKLFSDNGTNFRGADAELRRSFAALDKTTIQEKATNRGVEWNFIPPGSPHMGGAWERLIRAIKTALRVILKERAPREETLLTLLAEVEGIVNSRPLTHVSVDSEYDEALTPNHFLIGTSSPSPTPGSFNNNEFYLRRQWRIAQRLTDMFWQRWMKEVLPVLTPRSKWCTDDQPIKVGDLVLIVDPNLPRNTWPRGLVTRVHPGKDGRVRVVDVKTKAGIFTRPVTRIALLPTIDECRDRSNGTRAENVGDV